MRTPAILFATLLLTVTAASAAPRSLSTGEPTVELPVQKVQVLEAPKVELAPAAQADAPRPTPTQGAPVIQPETKAVEAAPAEVKPVVTAPPTETKPVVAAPVETKQVETTPTVKPVKQASVQRKPKQRQAGIDQRIPRELRGIERTIGISLGAAALSYGLASVPYYSW